MIDMHSTCTQHTVWSQATHDSLEALAPTPVGCHQMPWDDIEWSHLAPGTIWGKGRFAATYHRVVALQDPTIGPWIAWTAWIAWIVKQSLCLVLLSHEFIFSGISRWNHNKHGAWSRDPHAIPQPSSTCFGDWMCIEPLPRGQFHLQISWNWQRHTMSNIIAPYMISSDISGSILSTKHLFHTDFQNILRASSEDLFLQRPYEVSPGPLQSAVCPLGQATFPASGPWFVELHGERSSRSLQGQHTKSSSNQASVSFFKYRSELGLELHDAWRAYVNSPNTGFAKKTA